MRVVYDGFGVILPKKDEPQVIYPTLLEKLIYPISSRYKSEIIELNAQKLWIPVFYVESYKHFNNVKIEALSYVYYSDDLDLLNDNDPFMLFLTDEKGRNDSIIIDSEKNIFTSKSGDNRLKIIDDLPNHEIKPEYLNTDHPTYSCELAAAIETWENVLKNNPPKPNRGSRKSLIEKHLKDHYSHFSTSAIDRITGILNPDKTGGVPKSEINLPTP